MLSKIFIKPLIIILILLLIIINGTISRLYSTDPDIYRDLTGFIISRGFTPESYEVETEDGYLLNIYRIVNPRPKYAPKSNPVLMVHGISDNGETWTKNRPGFYYADNIYREDNGSVVDNCVDDSLTNTLAFTLAACGWDVWLANLRGNQYSNQHVSLNNQDPEYWNFTLTQVGVYDIPATIDKVLEITNKETLSVIGYSMGSTVIFAFLSLYPKYESYFRPFIAFAPITYMRNIRSAYKYLAPIEPIFRSITIGFGLPIPVSEFIGAFICGNSALVYLCIGYYGLLYGFDFYNTDKKRYPVYFANSNDYTSIRILLHYAQLINSRRFAQFNYGEHLNQQIYNQSYSPDYPLQDITLQHIYLFCGRNDYLAELSNLPVKELEINPWFRWSHTDFALAKHANIDQDQYVLDILELGDRYTLLEDDYDITADRIELLANNVKEVNSKALMTDSSDSQSDTLFDMNATNNLLNKLNSNSNQHQKRHQKSLNGLIGGKDNRKVRA